MKKLLVILTTLFVLVGCKDAVTKVSEDEKLFKVGNYEYSKEDLYETMKRTDRGTVILQDAQKVLSDGVELTDDMKKEAQEMVDNFKQIFGDEFDKTLAQIGFDSEEAYMESLIYPDLKFKSLTQAYVEENLDKFVDEYKPLKARILQVDAEKADEIHKEIKESNDFEKVAKENASEGGAYHGEEKLYLVKATQFPASISNYLKDVSETGLSEVIKNDATESTYIIEVTETDAEKMQDEVISEFVNNQQVSKEIVSALFKKHDFKVYDKVIYDHIQENFPEYLQK